MSDIIYQTLNEFLTKPFGKPINETSIKRYNDSYTKLMNERKILFKSYTTIDDSYLLHIKIPSESKDGIFYDVVIQFFSNDNTDNLSNYYVQFFSNSPSFTYRYAALYRNYGYLIEALYNKLDPEYSRIFPDRLNPEYKLEIDKSLYLACKFIAQHNHTFLNKISLKKYRYLKSNLFIKSILDVNIMNTDLEFAQVEKSIKKEMESDKKKSERFERGRESESISSNRKSKGKIKPTLSTVVSSDSNDTKLSKYVNVIKPKRKSKQTKNPKK